MTSHGDELAFAVEIAHIGGDIAMSHYQKGPSLQRKGDGTWVTAADVEVETRLRVAIAESWPDHNVLGEEQGFAAANGGPPVEGAPTWIVDPIDGTHNYMSGIPIWGTLIGLRTEDGFVVGVCHAPALGETYEAATGSGARMNGAPIEAASVADLSEATTVIGGAQAFVDAGLERFLDELTMSSWRIRGFGDFWGHMLVARGAAHVMVEPLLNVWDTAALVPIVTEAGAKITHLDGSDWTDDGSCLTACAPLHDQVVGLAARTT
ncbi:MAG TPA: inositol monophosphatase family protein [Actinomycetota bacterium]|nr:inositol monophosphatase family protein [Actinomycetota bacterium]